VARLDPPDRGARGGLGPPALVQERLQLGRELLLQLAAMALRGRQHHLGRRDRTTRPLRRSIDGLAAHLAEREPALMGETPRPPEVPARQARGERGESLVDAALRERPNDEVLGERPERDDVAPRQHGLRKLVGPRRQ
jgi:hypothetical protein